MNHGNQRDGGSGQNLGWKLSAKDKCVKQESRTLDPEWRDSQIPLVQLNHVQWLSPLVIPLAKCDEPAIRRVAYPTTSGQWLQNPRARFPKTGPENKFTNFL